MGRTTLAINLINNLLVYPQWVMIPIVLVIFGSIELLKIGYLREFSPMLAQAF